MKYLLAWLLLDRSANILSILNEAPEYPSQQHCVVHVLTRIEVDPVYGIVLPGQMMDGLEVAGFMCRPKVMPSRARTDRQETT